MLSSPLIHDGRDNRLLDIRLFLAVLVVFSHCYLLGLGPEGGEPLLWATGDQITLGSLAVDAFFAISGLLITASWLRSRGLLDYLARRCLRIYPGFALACAFTALVAGPLGSASGREYWSAFWWGDLPRTILWLDMPALPPTFVDNPFPGHYNGSLWTIKYEFFCYLGVAALGLAGLLSRWAVLWLLAASLAALAWFDAAHSAYLCISRGQQFGLTLPFVGNVSAWARFLSFFLAGSAAYLWREAIPRSKLLAWGSVAILGAGAFVPPGFVLALPTCGVYLLFWWAFEPGARSRVGDVDLSYGVYLYAFPIQQWIVANRPGVDPWTFFLLAMPPILALALVSWYGVERPANSMKSRLAGRVERPSSG